MPTLPGQADRLLRELEWKVIRRLDGLLQGDYRTLMRGSGLDLADLREYQPHDDVRHIDWNVTARLNTPHVRVFTEDREMTAWFLLDLSPSINFGPQGNAKRDILTGFVAVLSRLLTRHGNRVGAMLYGAGNAPARAVDAVLPPRNSRAHVLHLVHRLLTPPAPTTGTSKPGGGATELHRLLQTGLANLRRRSTVFVVSDFISAPGWEKPLAQLAQRHDVVAVRLLDPLELELPDVGLITLRDAESGEQLQVDTHDAGFRRRFAHLAAEREAALREGLTRAGADTLELCTDDDLVDALLRFMDLRQRRVRTSRASTSRAADPAQHAA
ncbi:ATPase [Acidovorax sp. Root275]|nr:ATPase [Acidovorax sp. Root275]